MGQIFGVNPRGCAGGMVTAKSNCRNVGEVGVILIGFLHIFIYTDCPILHKLFDFCPFMQTVILPENHFEGFGPVHTPSPKSGVLTSFSPYENSPEIRGFSDIPF